MVNDARSMCEVNVDGAWLAVGLAEAHGAYRNAAKRCPACGGTVRTMGSYTFGGRTTMAHLNPVTGRVVKAQACAADLSHSRVAV